MNIIQIETAQNVKINQKGAKVTDRMLAILIDWFFIFAYYLLFSILITGLLSFSSSNRVLLVLISLPVFFYHLLFEYLMDGQSPGKRIIGIKVVNLDGSRPSLLGYLLRWIFRIIDIVLLAGSVALIVIMFSKYGQRLGDIVAGTIVIDNKKKRINKSIIFEEEIEDYTPVFQQVTMLTDKDMKKIKEVFTLAKRKYNTNLLKELAFKIKEITGIESTMPEGKFVDTVIKDYNHFTS